MEGAGMTQGLIIPITHIERKPNSNQYRIVGKGVSVAFLSRLIDDPEWTVERICANYGLSPAEVYAAWAFYYDHQAEIDGDLHEAAVKFEADATADADKRARLQERYRAKTGHDYPPEDVLE
jgi:uncharacterized protein (DUF433 family)